MKCPSRILSGSLAGLILAPVIALALPLAAADASPDVVAGLQSLMAEGKYAEAETAGRAELDLLEARYGDDAVELVEVLDILLEARWRGGKATEPETRALGERGLAIKRRALGADDAGVGKSLHHLAIVAFFNGDFETAGENWRQAIEIRERALGADHPDVAESMNGLANLLLTTGEFDAAARLYEDAVRIRERAYGPMDPRVGHTLNNLALLRVKLGDFAEALPLAERSLEIKREMLGPEHPEIAVGMLSLADLLDQTGDRVRARELAAGAVKICEKAHGEEHPEVAAALNNLAEQLRRAGEYAEALPLYERALAIWEKAQGPDHPDVAIALNNLGMLLEAMGEDDRARAVQERSVQIREQALGPDHPDLAESLHNLAALWMRSGEIAKARAALERCVEIRRSAFGTDNPRVADSMSVLARVQALGGETGAALDLALEAERIGRDHLRLTGRSLAEEHALRYAETRSRGLDLALTLAAEQPQSVAFWTVLDTIVRSRAVVLDEMAARNRSIVGSTDPEVVELALRLAQARARLANLTVRGLAGMEPEAYRSVLDEARETKEKAERALGVASTEFAGEQQRNALGIDDIADRRPAATALVAFSLYRHLDVTTGEETDAGRLDEPVLSYLAFVLGAGDRAPVAVPLGPADTVDAAIAAWKREAAGGAHNIRRTAAESEAAYREVAAALRERIWTPLVPHLEGAGRVFLVPDGQLNLVSFAALPTDADRYLIDTGPELHYLSAERDLVPIHAPNPGTGLLAVGGPDYDTTALFGGLRSDTAAVTERAAASGGGRLQTIRFDPLPAAVDETARVVAMWRDVDEASDAVAHLTGAEASEAAFKNGAPGRRNLHVATHGFFLGGDSLGGAGTRGFKIVKAKAPAPAAVRVSPLLLSGLALAGANHRDAAGVGEEDGILTAEEIAALDLSGIEWAVLSACDTGVGEIRAGEGVFGLRRAMQVAGVRTLIMSLWPVDDEATMEWMTGLYSGRLGQKLDSASAARAAGLGVLEGRRGRGESTHPFYWAAFVAAGDWR